MTERQLRMAITEPAKKADSGVDDDLAEVLLGEVRTRRPGTSGAGMLPLLSHALDQTWRSRAGEAVTLADYERTGGIEGAVAGSAQRAYDALTPAQQAAARQVFLRLTATSAEGIDSADRATKPELTDGKTAAGAQDVEQVLEAFAAERLLTLGTDTVEISHEALLTAWPLLRDTWLADTHTDRIIRTRLHTTATDWAHHSRDPSYLYSGTLLAAATGTAARIRADPTRHPPLTQTETDFLHTSNHAHSRTVRRRQAFIAFLMILVIGLASATALAIRANQQTARQRDIAISGQLISRSETVGDTNPIIAKLLSLAAWRLNPSSEARDAMLAAAALRGITILSGHTGPVFSVAFSPNGKTLASRSLDGTVRLWNVGTHRQIGILLAGHTGPVNSVAFSPNGKTLASGSLDGTVRLWNVGTHRQIGILLAGHTGPVNSVAFSPDGKTLAVGGSDGTVRLWEAATGRKIGSFTSPPGDVILSVAFSPDGKTLAAGGFNGTVVLWDVAYQQQIGDPLIGHTGPVFSVAFSSDGKTLASGSDDHTVRLWNVDTGRQTGGLPGRTSIGGGQPVALSPDGQTLAASDGRTVQLWNMATGHQIGPPLTVPTSNVLSVALSPDGKTLAGGDIHGLIRLWDTATGQQIGPPLTSPASYVLSVVFSPDGHTLAASGGRTVRLWDVATGHQVGALLAGSTGAVLSVAFSPDGKTLASGGEDGTVRLWDVATRHQIGAPLAGSTGPVLSVAFSPDGKTLASGDSDDTVRLWDVATRHQIGAPLTSPPPAKSRRWPSVRTARPWPAAAAMARSGCGTWPPAIRSAPLSPDPPARSCRWRSARTARPWSPPPPAARRSRGTSPT
jgi:WD40 repeat protein